MPNAFDKYAVVTRYLITIVLTLLAGKLGLDAAAKAQLIDAIMTLLVALGAITPLIYALIKRPSPAAMEVAKQADKVLAGQKDSATVQTPSGQPNLTVQPTIRGK